MSSQHESIIKQGRVLIVKKYVWLLLTRMLRSGDPSVARFCSVWISPLKGALMDTEQHADHSPQEMLMAVVWVRYCLSTACVWLWSLWGF
jgi:hypothetical protein